MQIAVCEDIKEEQEAVSEMLSRWKETRGEKAGLRSFERAEAFLAAFEAESYRPDLVLLDIFMPGLTGIEAAERLRKQGYDGDIVFLTTSKDFALNAYAVDALQYLVKPVKEEEFFRVLDKAALSYQTEIERYLSITAGRQFYRFAVSDFIYGEAAGHSLMLHFKARALDKDVLKVSLSVSSFVQMTERYPEIVRAGAGFVINLSHISSLSTKELRFDNGVVIYPPRSAYRTLKEQYMQYCFTDAM
ncbi:MAG TPA: hypothetical protein DCL38_04020 [Lachnospiraceae bacterium]|nr:hypothetical protein [Lachnospiraceae bacterium]